MNGRVNGRRHHTAAARFPSSYGMRPPSRRPPRHYADPQTAPGRAIEALGTNQQRAFRGQVAGMGISRGNLVRAFSESATITPGTAAAT